MSTELTWTIEWMNAYPQEAGEADVVFQVGWMCTGTIVDGENHYVAGVGGSTPVTYSAGSPFVPYSELTQDQVLGWVWANCYPSKDQVEAQVQEKLDLQMNPPIVQPPLPWA